MRWKKKRQGGKIEERSKNKFCVNVSLCVCVFVCLFECVCECVICKPIS